MRSSQDAQFARGIVEDSGQEVEKDEIDDLEESAVCNAGKDYAA